MKFFKSILAVWVMLILMSSCTSDMDLNPQNRPSLDLSGVYSDTFSIEMHGRNIIDTVIKKRVIKINDSIYQMPLAIDTSLTPWIYDNMPVAIYINSYSTVITRSILLGPSCYGTGYVIPSQMYFNIRLSGYPYPFSQPVIDRMRKIE